MFSSVGLVVLAPFFLLIGLAIRVDSHGPVFYLQQRIGKNGRPFRLFKFRTMHCGADKSEPLTIGNRDARITRFGYWLRRFKLDELPQLVNVLMGNMSLVGPRPELKKFVDLYTDEQRKVLSVKPGITDYASIEFRNENKLLEGKEDPIAFYIKEIMPAKLALNQKYINERSFRTDVIIIFRTLQSLIVKSH